MVVHSDQIVESKLRAGLSGWRAFLLVAAGWLAVGPLAVWLLVQHLRLDTPREIALGVGFLVSAIGIICMLIVFRTAYFAIARDQLQIGRSPRETIVSFAEIESIVEGLPAQQSLTIRSGRISHYSEMSYRKLAHMRGDAIFLRLSGGRYLAFYISSSLFANAHTVRMCLLERNRSNLVGDDSYTPEEVKRLGNVAFNAIRMF
jgi:hypothetical protein